METFPELVGNVMDLAARPGGVVRTPGTNTSTLGLAPWSCQPDDIMGSTSSFVSPRELCKKHSCDEGAN